MKPEEISDGIGGQTDVTLGDQLTTSGFDGEGVGPDTLEYAFHGLDSYEWFAQQLYDLKRASVSEDMQTMQEILQKMNYEGLTVGASISHDHMKGALYAGMYSGARVDYMTALMAFEREEITVEELEQAYEVFVAVREKVVEGVKSAGFVD